MNAEGPAFERLNRRLSECPAEFLAEPRIGRRGLIHVDAVVADLLRDLGGEPRLIDIRPFRSDDSKDANRLSAILVACWLLHDDAFIGGRFHEAVFNFLVTDIPELAQVVPARQLVNDADRREELIRLALKSLRLRPARETPAQAQDRLTTVSTVERRRVVAAARAAEERARAIREAMAKKAAEEAAARYMRE
jgi:hypothetical protein